MLRVENLSTEFLTRGQPLRAVDGVSFDLGTQRTLGLVGESGSGKSATALSILRLIPPEQGRIVSGQVWLDDRDLLALSEREMREVRGAQIAMIFQDPMSALNPVLSIGSQLIEAIRLHQPLSRRDARKRAIELLDEVSIPAASERLDEYPHQFSGGMRQRALIAMALACNPKILIADEPTTALDVTVQRQILDLLLRLKDEHQMSVLLITHDLGVIAEFADDVAVMYAGRIVEHATTPDLFAKPEHPYTRGLLASLPDLKSHDRSEKLKAIPGQVPRLGELPPGCSFQNRCNYTDDECRKEEPELIKVDQAHKVACHRAPLPSEKK